MPRDVHSICRPCWDERVGPGHDPLRAVYRARLQDLCCWCGTRHWSGIRVGGPPLWPVKCLDHPQIHQRITVNH